jgi:hypothetical protein
MNSAVATPGGNVNSELLSLLSGYTGFPQIADGIAACAGTEATRLNDPTFPVLGFLVQPADIFTAWLATPSGYHVFELARGGESLIVSVPWSRVARIVASADATNSTLSVEIDGDRQALGAELRDGQVTGSLRPAGYVLTSSDETDRLRMTSFAALLRRLIV